MTNNFDNSVTDRGLLAIAGPGAKDFLQGQLTCDLEKISPTHSSFGAHCNPQGRIISFFSIYLHEDTYYLLMPGTLVPLALDGLKKYAVFFKVSLTDVSAMLDQLITAGIVPATEPSWHQKNIHAGIPSIYPETSTKFLPHDLGLHQLAETISFNKGCYTGQEIIARMHYRGKLKNHLQTITLDLHTPPLRGNDLIHEEKTYGTVVDFASVGPTTYELLVITQ